MYLSRAQLRRWDRSSTYPTADCPTNRSSEPSILILVEDARDRMCFRFVPFRSSTLLECIDIHTVVVFVIVIINRRRNYPKGLLVCFVHENDTEFNARIQTETLAAVRAPRKVMLTRTIG